MVDLACPDDRLLADYLAGQTSAVSLESISAHISTCPRCVERLDGLNGSTLPKELHAGSSLPADRHYAAAVDRLLRLDPRGPGDKVGPGTVLRDYRLFEFIGEGGMGSVFKAIHERLGKIVAVKVIRHGPWADAAAIARFEREMKSVGKLHNPHIVQATDAGDHDGTPFLVMEYVDGQNLSKMVKTQGPLLPRQAFDVIRQAARGLQHAHDSGLIHRDVKPSNLIMSSDGCVKILDLGLAVAMDQEPIETAAAAGASTSHGSDLTSASHAVGTFEYMAPEQRRNAHAVDVRADVYGLGATLWFLLTGERVPADWRSRTNLPGRLSISTWEKFLAAEPANRFRTVSQAAAALKPPAARWLPKVAAAVLLPLLAFGIWYIWKPKPLPGPITPAALMLPFDAAAAAQSQTDWAKHLGLPPRETRDAVSQTFALIPPGTVPMGDQCHVRITRPYYLATCEVTHLQFERFVNANKYVTTVEANGQGGFLLNPKHKSAGGEAIAIRGQIWRTPGHEKVIDDQPVTQVSWTDAKKYCEWLGTLDSARYRLPTEAELAWAARAGDANDNWFGPPADKLKSIGWLRRNSTQPQPVGKLAPNAWGLYDMLGNVAELCRDRHGDRPPGMHDDYAGPPAGDYFVMYGFSHLAAGFKYQFRDRGRSDDAFGHVGFRVVRDLPDP